MADATTVSNVKVPAPVGNGAAEPAKRVTKPREVPMIAVSASKDEYAEIKNGLNKLLAGATAMGVTVEVPLGPFVLACALKTIRAAK